MYTYVFLIRSVRHWPCGHDTDFWMKMHEEHGLDLLVTGRDGSYATSLFAPCYH